MSAFPCTWVLVLPSIHVDSQQVAIYLYLCSQAALLFILTFLNLYMQLIFLCAVLLCLVVCLTLLASFSHLSFKECEVSEIGYTISTSLEAKWFGLPVFWWHTMHTM